MDLYSVFVRDENKLYANGLCYEAADITDCVNSLNFNLLVSYEYGNKVCLSHKIDLNTLCNNANVISRSANLGDVTIKSINSWEGKVGNVYKALEVKDCAFYGSFKGTLEPDGIVTYNYFGDKGTITNSKNNVFLCKDGYTFSSNDTKLFNCKTENLTPGSYANGVYAYPEYMLKVDDTFSALNSESTKLCVWGKIKGRGEILDGCPLPVVCGGVLDADLKGKGTEENPWLVGSEAELRKLAADVNEGKVDTKGKYFALSADIDMTNSEVFEPIGNSENRPFGGTFDGQGHVISGIKIKNLGMFGYGDNCTLKRLAVVGAEFEDTNLENCAVLLGHETTSYGNHVSDCYVGGDIKISADKFSVAGILGHTTVAYISNCYFKGRFVVGSKNSATNSLSGIISSCGYLSHIENCYASFSVVAPDDMNIEIAGISNKESDNAKNNYSVCGQINIANEGKNGKICTNDSEIFAGYQFPSDSPWTKGVFRYVLKDAKNYVATAADGTDTEVYYDAIAMTDSNNPSNDICHYTLKDGEESDKLLWALPNLAIYNPADRSEYIINCTLDPTKPFNYNTKASCKAEAVKVNMSYPLALETGKYYYPLCLPGTVHKKDFLFDAELYIGGEVKTDKDGNKYMNIVQADSVEGGIPFVAYIPSMPMETGSINVSMRSRMALEPLESISGGGHTQNFALTGTYKGGTMSDVCNNIVESDNKIYIKKVEGQQTVPPFSAYLSDEDNVELRNYLLLDETSNDIAEVIADNKDKNVKTMLKRALVKEKWNTVCLPTTLSSSEIESLFGVGTKLEQLSSVKVNEEGGCTLVFTKATGIEAGKSYLIMPTNDNVVYDLGYCDISENLEPSECDITIDGAAATIKFCGTFERKLLGVDGEEEYFTQDNTIYHVADGQQIVMNGFRCYITANKVAAAAMAKACMVHSDGSTTALRLVEVGSTADGKQRIYNLQGIEQNSDSQQRGIYIKGGRKYVK